MSVRQSKRLKASAAKAVATASAPLSTRAGGRKTRAKATTETTTTETTTVETTTVKTTVEVEVEASATPATAATAEKKAGGAAKDAWGVLFASQKARKTSKAGESARPRRVDGVPAELQARVDAFPRFEGVSRRGEAASVKVVAWNVNGLRAVLKRDDSAHLRAYVAQEDPDVLCLSETKIGADELQKLDDFLPQYAHQFWSCATKKGYSGTAIFSKTKPLRVKDAIVVGAHTPKASGKATADAHEEDQEGRFLAAEFAGFWVVHTYVPNAGGALERLDYRTTQWDRAMERELCALERDSGKPVVWCGDLNVAHEEIDIHDPKGNRNKSAGFTDQERESFSQILAAKSGAESPGLGDGFVDTFRALHPEEQQFSYFSYRFNARARNKGWRLDYFVASRALLPRVVRTALTSCNVTKRLTD
jgi:exodeoxyribonuclease III